MEHKLSKHIELDRFPEYFEAKDLKGFSVRQLQAAALAEMARCCAEVFWLYLHQTAHHKYVSHLDLHVSKGYDNPYSAKTMNFFYEAPGDLNYVLFPLLPEEKFTYQHSQHYRFESHLWDSALKIKVYLTSDFNALSGEKKLSTLKSIMKECKIQAITDKNDYLKNAHSAFAQHLFSLNWPKRIDKSSDINELLSEFLPHELGKKRLALIEKETFEKELQNSQPSNCLNKTKSINKI